MNPEKINPKIPKITETYKNESMESLRNIDDITTKEYLFRNIIENKSLDIFLVDMKRDFQTFNKIYATYFKDNQPCRTTVAIDSLPTPIAIELKCIATL